MTHRKCQVYKPLLEDMQKFDDDEEYLTVFFREQSGLFENFKRSRDDLEDIVADLYGGPLHYFKKGAFGGKEGGLCCPMTHQYDSSLNATGGLCCPNFRGHCTIIDSNDLTLVSL